MFVIFESIDYILSRVLYLMPILIVWWMLLLFWLFALYSVSIFESFDLTLDMVADWRRDDPSNYFYFFQQVTKLAFGLVIAVITWFVPLRLIKKRKYIIFLWCCLLLWLLFFSSFAQEFGGATWWIVIGWQSIQPSEFFKIGFVMFLASWLVRKRKIMNDRSYYLWFCLLMWCVSAVFLLIPDLWTVLVIGLVALIMFWYAWGKTYHIAGTFVIVWLVLSVAYFVARHQNNAIDEYNQRVDEQNASIQDPSQQLEKKPYSRFTYIQRRIDYFVNPNSDTEQRWIWWQTQQALIAVGGWGFIWNGYGKWLQKFGYIPEAQSDFIFASFAEEIGFLGNAFLLILYFLLAWYVLKALPQVKNDYDRLFAVWLISMIIVQVFINIWVNINILPLTWLTLPFVSHGWSALIVNIIQLVLLQKIVLWK